MVLPKSMRLKGYKSFDKIHKYGKRYHSSLMTLRVIKSGLTDKRSLTDHCEERHACKMAIAISNKVSKSSVFRNRLRRYLHDHLRTRLSSVEFSSTHLALLSLKPHCSEKPFNLLSEECDRLLYKAGLWK